jgi:hypothetical protein
VSEARILLPYKTFRRGYMDDRKLPIELEIPSEEEEHPVRSYNGFVLASDAKHCRPKHLWPNGMQELDQHPDWKESIERYLAAFCEPVTTAAKEICCVACNEQVTGHHMGLDDPRYATKLTYSPEGTMEGRCSGCGYPCRLRHEIALPTGQPLVRIVIPLFYHPSACQQAN